jgi:hypothetical protein
MGRYLKIDAAKLYLNLGKTIEVFLGRVREDKRIITYLVLTKYGTQIKVQVFDHYDERNQESTDIYIFPPIAHDLDETYFMRNIEEVIDFIQMKFQQHSVNFVNRGKCQHEYEDMLLTEGLQNKFTIVYDSIIWN